MKTRKGFVSNSSSSSFIIAIEKELHKCPTCHQAIGFRRLINNDKFYENEILLDDVHHIIKDVQEMTGDGAQEIIDKIMDACNRGKEILKVEISDHAEELREFIFSDNVEILSSDEDWGY